MVWFLGGRGPFCFEEGFYSDVIVGMFWICETFGKSDCRMSAAGVGWGALTGVGMYCNMEALVIVGREGDNVDAAVVRKVVGENDVDAAVSSGGL